MCEVTDASHVSRGECALSGRMEDGLCTGVVAEL